MIPINNPFVWRHDEREEQSFWMSFNSSFVAIRNAWKTWAIFLVLSSWKHCKTDYFNYFVVFIGRFATIAAAIFFAPFNCPYLSKMDIISNSLPLFTFLLKKYYIWAWLSKRRISHIKIFIFHPRESSFHLEMITIKTEISEDYIEVFKDFSWCDRCKIFVRYLQSFPLIFGNCWFIILLIVFDDLWI